MADTLPEFDENYRPISHYPLSLLDFTSMKIALNILLEKFNQVYLSRNISPLKFTELEVNPEILTQVPYKIKEMVTFWIYPVARKLDQWVAYFKHLMKNFPYESIYSRFNLVVFEGSGNIHFKHTIANFIRDDSLDPLTRFEMACMFCLEEGIDILWPQVSHTFRVDNVQLFKDNFLMCYWVCRKKEELHGQPWPTLCSIERIMVVKCIMGQMHLIAVNFINMMDLENQILEIRDMFAREGDRYFEYGLNFILALDTPFQHCIFEGTGTKILRVFVRDYEPIEYVVQCWNYIKHRTNGNQFFDLIQFLITFRRTNFTNKKEVFKYEYVEMVLTEIWCSASQDQKSLVKLRFSETSYNLTLYQSKSPFCGLNRDIRFLRAVLSDLDDRSRNTFWMENWPQWIRGVPSSQFEELMKLCLMNTEAIEDFKKILPESVVFRKYHDVLICKGYYRELNEFLTALYSNPDRVSQIKRTLLGDGHRFFWLPHEPLDAYARYIDTLFPDNTLAEEFKDELIFSDRIFELLVDEVEHHETKLVVESFLSSKKQDEFKNEMLNCFFDKITDGGGRKILFDGIRWRKNLLWCLNEDEERFDEFMRLLMIHDIFENQFSKVFCSPALNSFGDLNLFFKRYFKSRSEYEKFVSEKVEYYEAMGESDIESIFGASKMSVVGTMKARMVWNDEDGTRNLNRS